LFEEEGKSLQLITLFALNEMWLVSIALFGGEVDPSRHVLVRVNGMKGAKVLSSALRFHVICCLEG
jgi:hypothetical protein